MAPAKSLQRRACSPEAQRKGGTKWSARKEGKICIARNAVKG
jgi:hypothetical protein